MDTEPDAHDVWLLATEHQDQDQGAERVALALATRVGGRLAVVMPLLSNAEYEAEAPQQAANAEGELASRRAAVEALADAAGVRLELSVRRGADAAMEIVGEARARAAQLLIIRRRGRQGLLAQMLVGEMVSRVLAQSPCSVLVVPRDGQPPSSGVLAVLAAASESTSLVTEAAGLAARLQLPLHLLCVAPTESDRSAAQAALARAAQALQAPVASAQLQIGAPLATIQATAAACGADLVVVARAQPSRWAALRSADTALQVVGHAGSAVLVHVPPLRPRGPDAR